MKRRNNKTQEAQSSPLQILLEMLLLCQKSAPNLQMKPKKSLKAEEEEE